MVTRPEACPTVVNGLGDRKEARPSDIIKAMYEDKDGGKDNQCEPEGKVVNQRVI